MQEKLFDSGEYGLDDDDFLKYGSEDLKYMFDGAESLLELALTLQAVAEFYRSLSIDCQLTNPVDSGLVSFERKDGKNVYELINNSLRMIDYDAADE